MPREPSRRGESGTTVPLIVGLAVILLTLVAVVTDASSAFVRRQGLDGLADGAALRGADLGYAAVAYTGSDGGTRLREVGASARRAVTDYLREVGAYDRYPGLTVAVDVDPDDRSVRVRLHAVMELPLGVPGVVRRAPVAATGRAAVARDIPVSS